MAKFTKKDIERARERNALKIGRAKFGSKVTSVEQLDFSKQAKMKSVGFRLAESNKKQNDRYKKSIEAMNKLR